MDDDKIVALLQDLVAIHKKTEEIKQCMDEISKSYLNILIGLSGEAKAKGLLGDEVQLPKL